MLNLQSGVSVRSHARHLVHARKEQSARPYPQIGLPEAHHPLCTTTIFPSCSRTCPDQPHHTELFAQYLAKLRGTPDGDGSLLDHMTILYGSGISNTRALRRQLAPAAVGGGAGRLKAAGHVKYSGKPRWQTCS